MGSGVPEEREAGKRPADGRHDLALLAGGMLLPFLVFFFLLPTFYYSLSPGSSEPVETHIKVEGFPALESGDLYLTSVSVDPLSCAGLLAQALAGSNELESMRGLVGPGRGMDEYNARSDRLMQISKETAAAVALAKCGYEVPREKVGVLILGFSPGAPLAGFAEVGDVIVEVDGKAVGDTEELRERLSGKRPGEPVDLVIERGGEEGKSESLRTETTAMQDDPDRAALGIAVRDFVRYRFPLEVEIDMEGYTGPSAGLMLALGTINVIRGGGLVGDVKVAGTGEIFPDGSVGPIGGIDLKIRAAAAAGVALFLVPSSNYGEITVFPEGLLVVPVENIDDALMALGALRSEGETP